MRVALAALWLAGCGCEGRAFTVLRGDHAVARGCAEVADTAAARSVGLIGRAPPPEGRALWLEFPMVTEACVVNGDVRFAIAVAYVAPDGEVAAVSRDVAANDATPRCRDGVAHVIEWAAATAPDVRTGDRVRW